MKRWRARSWLLGAVAVVTWGCGADEPLDPGAEAASAAPQPTAPAPEASPPPSSSAATPPTVAVDREPASCAETCDGCCDAEGNCFDGDTSAACGAGGERCAMCRGTCAEGRCSSGYVIFALESITLVGSAWNVCTELKCDFSIEIEFPLGESLLGGREICWAPMAENDNSPTWSPPAHMCAQPRDVLQEIKLTVTEKDLGPAKPIGSVELQVTPQHLAQGRLVADVHPAGGGADYVQVVLSLQEF